MHTPARATIDTNVFPMVFPNRLLLQLISIFTLLKIGPVSFTMQRKLKKIICMCMNNFQNCPHPIPQRIIARVFLSRNDYVKGEGFTVCRSFTHDNSEDVFTI